jgi:putative ABC transport system permease protein
MADMTSTTALASAMPPSVVTVIVIPYTTIALVVLLAAACGVIAGLVPARRAARLDVLEAIASE